MSKQTQRDKIATYLKAGNPITTMEAFSKFRITRLSAVIFALRYEKGMNVKHIDKSNKGKTWRVYYVGKKPSNI